MSLAMNNLDIHMVGSFPPPIHGMSLVNNAIKEKIISLGIQPIVINLSALSLSRKWYTRLYRIRKILRGLTKFIKTIGFQRNGVLYISISGGMGQIYEMLFIYIGRLYKKKIFIHHHSYAYLHKKNIITMLLTLLAGYKAIHIVACEDMAIRLKTLYSSVLKIVMLSGIVAVDKHIYSDQNVKKPLKTIGFISNISIEKGIIEFLDIVECLENDTSEINALIAGPFQDDKTENLVMNRLSKLKSVKYLGPRYGKEKSVFYENIDVLLFPTDYINESEGIVIHEAMSHRVPVIAKTRGCIESILKCKGGLAIRCNENFVKVAVKRLLHWRMFTDDFQQASLNALQRFSLYKTHETEMLEKLCLEMLIN